MQLLKNRAFYPRQSTGVDMFDRFKEHGRVNGAFGPGVIFKRAETNLQTLIAVEDVEAKPLTSNGQCLRIVVYPQQPNKLVLVAKALQQLPVTTTEIGDVPDPGGEQGFNDRIQAGTMQNRRH